MNSSGGEEEGGGRRGEERGTEEVRRGKEGNWMAGSS